MAGSAFAGPLSGWAFQDVTVSVVLFAFPDLLWQEGVHSQH